MCFIARILGPFFVIVMNMNFVKVNNYPPSSRNLLQKPLRKYDQNVHQARHEDRIKDKETINPNITITICSLNVDDIH